MKKRNAILCTAAVIYGAAMLYLLFFRPIGLSDLTYAEQLQKHFNPIPFHTIRLFLHSLATSRHAWAIRHAQINLFGNILLFIPLGWFPPMLSEKLQKFWKTICLAALVMTVVELLQMFLLVGTCDVDDIILNVTGAAIGYLLFRTGHWIASKK